jgi:hypothetical protein
MITIIIEGVLFVALLATFGALFRYLVLYHTPLGLRIRQTQNRRRIERAAELECSIHGFHSEEAMVRLPNGERICPECFKEVVNGKHD